MENQDQVNKNFLAFKGKDVVVGLRGDIECEGKLIAIDNYLNIVLENENGLSTFKGGNVVFISMQE